MSAEPCPTVVSPNEAPEASSLGSRRGVAILLLLCLVQFMDVLDASILNIALPSIKRDLDFSQQSLQWIVSGYILTYGGFLLLGGRAADLLGRRAHPARESPREQVVAGNTPQASRPSQ
jgi:MFS family permease